LYGLRGENGQSRFTAKPKRESGRVQELSVLNSWQFAVSASLEQLQKIISKKKP
jgi:hypothetical protein